MSFFGPPIRNGVPIGLGSSIGFGSAPFTPAELFYAGEQGFWYDPTDIPLAWRRNLLTYTEQFDNAVWTVASVSVSANSFIAPNNTLTADTISSSNGYFYQEITGLTANSIYTGSIYLYAPVAINGLFIRFTNTAFAALGSGAYVNVTAGWNRFTFTDNIGANTTIRFVVGGAGTFPNGTSMYVWGAQLELGSTASNYQQIVTPEISFLTYQSQPVLYQDSAGTTPVTAVEQAVGLMLDKSAPTAATGYYSGFFDGSGDYLTASVSAFNIRTDLFAIESWCNISTRTFFGFFSGAIGAGSPGADLYLDESAGIIYLGDAVINNITFSSSLLPLNSWFHFAVSFDGTTYRVFVNGSVVASSTTLLKSASIQAFAVGARISGGTKNITGSLSNFRVVKGNAVYTANFTPPTAPLTAISGTSLLTCQNNYFKDNSGNSLALGVVGNANPNLLNPFNATAARSVNNAFQTTSAKRPVLRARYNLLTYSEDFSNAAWGKTEVTATVNASTAPNGTNTANALTPSTNNSGHFFGRSVAIGAGVSYTCVFNFKANGYRWLRVAADVFEISFDCQTGTIGGTTGTSTRQISNLGNGWYQLVVTATSASASQSVYISINNANSTNTLSFAGDGTSNVLMWGFDLRPTSQATGLIGPTYQRIAAATDYDVVGFAPYLQFDGFDDALTTNSIDFSATDKMTVFAGVRKLSDAAVGMIAELSADYSSFAGSFLLDGPDSTGASGNFLFAARGSVAPGGGMSSGVMLAPTTRVLTGQADIAAPSRSLRVDGTQTQSSSVSLGTGNFGNYPLFIGARNQTSFYFNGWLSSLIGRGASTTAGQISATEQWIGVRTGVQI